MSRQNVSYRPAGAATAMGLVPSIGTRLRVGATSGELLVMLTPMRPCWAARKRIPAGDAVVIGAAQHHGGATDVAGALDGQVDRDTTSVMAPAVVGVHEHQGGPLTHHRGSGDRVHDPCLDERGVLRQAGRAMGRDAPSVGGEQYLRDVLGDVGRCADTRHDVGGPALQGGDIQGACVDRVVVDGHARQAIAGDDGPCAERPRAAPSASRRTTGPSGRVDRPRATRRRPRRTAAPRCRPAGPRAGPGWAATARRARAARGRVPRPRPDRPPPPPRRSRRPPRRPRPSSLLRASWSAWGSWRASWSARRRGLEWPGSGLGSFVGLGVGGT